MLIQAEADEFASEDLCFRALDDHRDRRLFSSPRTDLGLRNDDFLYLDRFQKSHLGRPQNDIGMVDGDHGGAADSAVVHQPAVDRE